MSRIFVLIVLAAMAGCATVHDDYGYYPGDAGGDYYYAPEPAPYYAGYGYSAYDSLFWGLQYSYFDPFYYPGFYYGVTFFPRNYGWSYWHASDYWAWRFFHPYAPYYGSYWDHYYDWNRPYGRHGRFHQHGRLSGRPGRPGDPLRYGSARNAAERMAREGRRSRAVALNDGWSTSSDRMEGSRLDRLPAVEGRRLSHRDLASRSAINRDLPSRHYVPRQRSVDGWTTLPERGPMGGGYDRRDTFMRSRTVVPGTSFPARQGGRFEGGRSMNPAPIRSAPSQGSSREWTPSRQDSARPIRDSMPRTGGGMSRGSAERSRSRAER